MGRRGPPPEPTALRLVKGNPGKRAANKQEPKLEVAPAESDVPERLKKFPVALAEWNRLYRELVEKGVLTIGDLTEFENYCYVLAQLRLYEELAEQPGAIISGHFGASLKLRAQLGQIGARLGLNPSARSGIKSIEKKPESKLTKFTAKR